MKIIKLLASAAVIVGTMPTLASPASATVIPDGTSTATMNSTCAADLASTPPVLLHDGTSALAVELEIGDQTDDASVEVPGSRVIDESSRFGTGTYTFSGLSIVGDPYRVGGSVNMFGTQGAKYKNWSNSEYDYTNKLSTTTHIAYSCIITKKTETFVPGVDEPGSPYYVNTIENGNGDCKGINPSNPHWGQDIGACKWTGTGSDPVHIPDSWLPGPTEDVATYDHSVDQITISDGSGHETNGGPYQETAPAGTLFNAAQVVVCISPKKLPGIWTNQNGYTGSKCNTTYFNSAPWGAGTNTSNGTYISVPGA
ncbi:MAG: hypothetical protein ACKOOL_05730 [Novosphingobium sp.]